MNANAIGMDVQWSEDETVITEKENANKHLTMKNVRNFAMNSKNLLNSFIP